MFARGPAHRRPHRRSRVRLVAAGLLLAAIGACAAPPGPSLPPGPARPIEAAKWFLAQTSARFTMHLDRFRPGKPDQALMNATGVVDPSKDRGLMRYDFWVTNPGEPQISDLVQDIAWGPADFWTAKPGTGPDREWRHAPRARARDMALVGRAQEEPIALFRFLATADAADVQPLPAAELDGVPVERWLLPVPVATTAAAFVPPDTYSGFERIYKRDTLPLEAWIADGRIVRIGYALDRDQIPAGGSDRTETWYDWSGIGEPIELVLPPPGRIVEIGL